MQLKTWCFKANQALVVVLFLWIQGATPRGALLTVTFVLLYV